MIYVTRTHKTMIAAAVLLVVIISGTIYIRQQDKATEINLGEATELQAAAVPTPAETAAAVSEEISVYICGNVKNPGVVEVKEGTRLDEAIKMAGGSLEKADLAAVNLAYRLKDEDMVYIPEKGEKPQESVKAAPGVNTVSSKSEDNTGKINLNTATESQLDTLSGIGPATAKAIIAYRNQVGAFSSIEEVKEVKGIGDAKFESMKDSITVD